MEGIRVPYRDLEYTLKCLKIQVIDSMPYIAEYVPDWISTPSELFYWLKSITKYKNDPKGVELLQTVQTLMKRDGRGDCDCFTILTLAACEYLGFKAEVILVGENKKTPTHIYSQVWDKSKNDWVVFDLTNPYYGMERKSSQDSRGNTIHYRYKQTLPFMILALEDGFFLASKASRKAKRAERTQRKIVKAAAKTARKASRQNRRTDRVVQKEARKNVKRALKVAKKDKKLLRVIGKQDVIKAKTAAKLNEIHNSSWNNSFSPESDFAPIPEEVPGAGYEAHEYEDQYYAESTDGHAPEITGYYDPEESEDYADADLVEEFEPEEMSAAFIPALVTGAKKLIKKASDKAKSIKSSNVVQTGVSKYNEITQLKLKNEQLTEQVRVEKAHKITFSAMSGGIGLLTGVMLGKSLK
jgi:hypothetical protein